MNVAAKFPHCVHPSDTYCKQIHTLYIVDKHLPAAFDPKWIPFKFPVYERFDYDLVYNFQLRQNNGLET